MIRKALCCILVCAALQYINAQVGDTLSPLNNLSFEENIPDFIEKDGGAIVQDSSHRVTGKYGMRWDFKKGNTLQFNGPIGYRPQYVQKEVTVMDAHYPIKSLPMVFNFPIYSEKEQDVKLRFYFGHDDTVDCFTDLYLKFDGWRVIRQPYDRGHLRGKPRMDMDFMRIEVVEGNAGTLFFDDMVFSKRQDVRALYADPILPYSKFHPTRSGAQPGHRIVFEEHLNKAWFPLMSELTDRQLSDFQTIDDRLWELEFGGRKQMDTISQEKIQDLIQRYRFYNITVNGEHVNGLHLGKGGHRAKYNRLAKELAILYRNLTNEDQKADIKDMVLSMIRHGIDCDVNLDWYHGRGFAEACYLMRDELKEIGMLDKAISFMRRKYTFTQFYNEDVVCGGHGMVKFSADNLYTNTIGNMICVLIMENTPEKERDMRHLVSFMSNIALNYANGLNDSFKPDGSHFHHANAYLTGYGYYTMHKVCEMIRILSGTEFRISEEAHERIKHNVLVRRFYRTSEYFPWAYAHNKIKPTRIAKPEEFRHLALAGTPDGKEKVDKEIAAAYLRLMQGKELSDDTKIFAEMGIQPEPTPSGHHTLSYFAKGIYRYDAWMSVVGAHSQYIYPMENWSWSATRGNTKFGMFKNWGSLEIIYPDKPGLEQVDNGWRLDGWDWTMIPGVTSLNAPLSRIKLQALKNSDDGDEEHLRSDQGFVGGLDCSNGSGVYVMKVRGHDKYQLESFYATKSWFFFKDLIICLGSDIRNDLPEYTTHTTLFQNSIEEGQFEFYLNKPKVLNDKYFTQTLDGQQSNWLLDSRNIGYYIPKGQNITLSYQHQKSRCYQDKLDTEGIYEKARIEHGNAPDGTSYEYAIKVQTSAKDIQSLAAAQESNEKIYRVLQCNQKGHIVHHTESSTTAYILFEQNRDINADILQGVSHSGIFTLQEKGEALVLSVSDPDIRLFEGYGQDVQIDLSRKEVAGYDNYWHANKSIASTIKVFLKGNWDIDAIIKGNGKVIQQSNGITVLEFICQDGLSNEIVLN